MSTSAPDPSPSPAPLSPLAAGGGLLLLAFVPFMPALSAGFVWDDYLVWDNPLLRSARGLWRLWADPRAMGERDPRYWPLLYTSFWLEYQFWGAEPFGYHFNNIALHALNCLLAWRILARLQIRAAWLGAALFAVHPVHAETVAWIIERKGVLSTFFCLGAFLAFLRVDADGGARGLALAALCFVCAYLVKPVVVTLPAGICVALWLRRGALARRDLFAVAPLFALAAAMTAWTIVGARESDPINFSLTLGQRIVISFRAILFYAGKLAWPSNLTAIYPRWEVHAGHAGSWIWLAAIGLPLAGLWAARGRTGRGPLAAALIYCITLGPTLGIMPFGYMERSFVADRYQYLASLAPLALAAAVFDSALARTRWEQARVLGAAIALSALAALSARQAALYHDLGTLFSQNAAKNPRCAIAWQNVGDHLLANGEAAAAIGHYLKSIELAPKTSSAWNNLGSAFAATGQVEEAFVAFLRAEALNPRNADNQLNLGINRELAGKKEEALAHYEAALRVRPDLLRARSRLAALLESLGRIDDAAAQYAGWIALDPASFEAQTGLGLILAQKGRLEDAEGHLAAAAALRPSDARARFNLGLCLAQQGKSHAAEAQFGAALEIDPNLAEARVRLRALESASEAAP